MKKTIIFILIIFNIISCNEKNDNSKFENQIVTLIKESCAAENCFIDLSEITSFKWNKLYVFKETASNAEVEKIINQKYPYFEDVARRFIFIDKNNKIVYHEDVFPNVEGLADEDVIFDIPDSINYKIYTNHNFKVIKEKIKKGHYYILKQ
ncbi:hypothetical protein M2347_000977 [Chryseobacterium sp. H1D6B]|uniref:hypothetical protein n=1 Tax=Chryseobacterium sp. H1D6B TaxID=2940588 RepID=UPI0015CD7B00|nr:hypothetical protein [Chryseobacterium sp. H1D6B]MDH6251250.1 hypothetical protein [Chryseobacterium sp. H1D6B]